MNKSKRKKTIIWILIWTILIAFIPFIVTKIKDNNYKNNLSYISSEYQIKNYSVTLDVDKDNKIDVTEEIIVDIPNNKQFNGIYKSIPLWKKYYSDNKQKETKIRITNLRAIGEKFVINSSSDKIGIRIGSTRTTTEAGLHTYIIKYRYDMGKDLNENKDELIFNVFDNYDDTAIDNMNIKINMPQDFGNSEISFIKGNQDITNNIDCKINDQTITASINEYLLDESVTIRMDLPNGYFVGETYNYGYICMMVCFSIIIISIISIIVWKKYGKNYEKKFKTVEFYPPEDFDAAQIGYIYGETSIKKLTSALIIQLASKGYISIDEYEKNKYRIVNIGKEKSNLKSLSITEQIVYVELFKNGNTNILNEDSNFPKVFNKLKSTLENTIDRRVNDVSSRRKMYITFGLLIVSVVAWIVCYIYIRDLEPKYNLLYTISFISIFITGFMAIIMERKTEFGEIIVARVLGFRDYLNITEKEELEALVRENPNYFYDILPYSYVLGISDKWIGKFEKNNVPNIDINALNDYESNFFMVISE